jgi:type II secretory pathway component PulF
VAVAEKSGNLDEALIEAAEDYEKGLTRDLTSLMTVLEPVLIICVGAIVGFIVVAMLLPIFELNAIIQ